MEEKQITKEGIISVFAYFFLLYAYFHFIRLLQGHILDMGKRF